MTNVRDRAWLARRITDPDKIIEEKDPIATALFQKYKGIRMHKLGLSQADVNTLVEYVKTQSASIDNREKQPTQK